MRKTNKTPGMLYDVTIFRGGVPHAEAQVFGFDAAKSFEEYYLADDGYEVEIEPNVFAYIRTRTPFKIHN